MSRSLDLADAAPVVVSVEPVPAPPASARSTDARRSAGWSRWAPALGCGLLMFAVAMVQAGRPVLTWDEVTTADVAQRSPAQIWHLMHNVDAVLGPYYLAMHGWIGLVGTSELALRLPSMVAMAAAVALAAELGRRLFGPLVGTTTGVILCITPHASRYAAEARPYAMTCLLSVLAVLLLHRAVQRPGPLRWVLYGGTVVLLGLSHLVALTTLCAHAAVVLVRPRGDGSWRTAAAWAGTVAVAVTLLLPMAWLGSKQQDVQLFWVAPLTIAKSRSFPGDLVGSSPTGWMLVGLASLAAWRPAYSVLQLAVLAVAPPAILAAVSMLSSPMWVYRYLLVVLMPLAMLAAVTIVRGAGPAQAGDRNAPARWAVGLRLATVLGLLAFCAFPGHRAVRAETGRNGPDYRGIAQLIRDNQHPGDAVVYEPKARALRAGMQYYLRRNPTAAPQDVLQRRPAAEVGWLTAEEHPGSVRLAGIARVWLVVDGVRDDPLVLAPALSPLLRRQYDRIGLWHVTRGTLALYRHRG